MLVGDKVKFVTLQNGKYLTLLGEIIRLQDTYTEICVIPKKVISFVVHNNDIIDVVDIHKTGMPEGYIEEFIKYEGENKKDILIELFIQGMCYLFAEWLHKKLLFSKIVYVREEHHYVVLWDNKLYDITGDVTNKYKDCHLDEHRFEGDWKRFR
jgi:hypothetical protein